MDSLIILITALLFFFIGKYSHKDQTITTIKDKIRQIKARDIPSVINYPTREEKDYEESQQKGIDEEIIKNLERNGLE